VAGSAGCNLLKDRMRIWSSPFRFTARGFWLGAPFLNQRRCQRFGVEQTSVGPRDGHHFPNLIRQYFAYAMGRQTCLTTGRFLSAISAMDDSHWASSARVKGRALGLATFSDQHHAGLWTWNDL
jgi:hypothetical protein